MKYLDYFSIEQNKIAYLLGEEPPVLSVDLLGSNFNFDFYNPIYLKTIRKIEAIDSSRIRQLEPDLADVTRITGWSTSKHVEYLDEEKDDLTDAIPFLRVQNVLPFKIDIEQANTEYITKEAHSHLKNSQIKPGDIVLTITGAVGRACLVPDGFRECNASQEIVRIRLKGGLNPHYLVAFLNSSLGRHQLWRFQTGSSRPRTLIRNVRKIKVIKPINNEIEKEVVEKAQYLESTIKKIENKIINQQKILSNLVADTLGFNITPKRWIYFDCNLYERFDVKSYDPKMGEICQVMEQKGKELGFDCVTLEDIVTIPKKPEISGGKLLYHRWIPSKNSPGGEYGPDKNFKHVRISDVNYKYCEIISNSDYIGSEAPSRARIVLHTNDVITATSGSATGTSRHKTAIVAKDYEGAIATTGFAKLKIKNDSNGNPKVPFFYLIALLKSTFVLEDIKRRTRGATIPSINENFDFLKVKIPLPSPEVRENIAKMAYNLICESKGAIADLNSINSVVISDIEQLILQ